MKRPARRTKGRSGDSVRQATVVIAIGALAAVGLFIAGKYIVIVHRTPAVITAMAAIKAGAKLAAAGASGAEGVYTGSILYMPDDGNVCRQLLFDNLTGRFTDNGNVDCLRATYGNVGGTPMQMSASRVRIISSGFRQHEPQP